MGFENKSCIGGGELECPVFLSQALSLYPEPLHYTTMSNVTYHLQRALDAVKANVPIQPDMWQLSRIWIVVVFQNFSLVDVHLKVEIYHLYICNICNINWQGSVFWNLHKPVVNIIYRSWKTMHRPAMATFTDPGMEGPPWRILPWPCCVGYFHFHPRCWSEQ